MKVRRSSIAGLLGLVLACGIGLAALCRPSPLCAACLFSLALGTLTVAVVAALIARERPQAYWIGFATCGLAYLGATFGPWCAEAVGPRLATTALLDVLYPPLVHAAGGRSTAATAGDPARLAEQVALMRSTLLDPDRNPQYLSLKRELDLAGSPGRWAAWTEPDRHGGGNPTTGGVVLAASEAFLRIGHALIALLCAAAGGLLGHRLFDRHRRTDRRSDAAARAAGLMLKVLETGL